MRGKMREAGVDLMIQRAARVATWMAVNRWIFLRGTCLKYIVSGWCFVGMKNRKHRSMNCIPFRVLTPMYMRTPYRTGMGMNLRMGASLTESPVSRKTQIPVTLCSLTPSNCGVSPGAVD